MIEFNVGNTWDHKLLDIVERLNDAHERTRITSLYGSTRESPLGNARTQKRLTTLSEKDMKEYIDRAHSMKVSINWTMNASCIGNVNNFLDEWNNHRLKDKVIKFLNKFDIDYVTLAHPYLILVISRMNVPISVSTIMNVTDTNKLHWFKDRKVNKICVPISKNRDREWLIDFVEVANSISRTHPIIPELIVNEFCHLGKLGNCEGLFRQSCYAMNSHSTHIEDDPVYPRAFCTPIRDNDPVTWLQSNWILPNHLKYYEEIGVNHFKITGRTHPTAFIEKILEYYMDESFDGELLELWPHLQTIGKSEKFKEEQQKVLDSLPRIPVSELDDLFNFCWVNGLDQNAKNGREICESIYKRIVKGNDDGE